MVTGGDGDDRRPTRRLLLRSVGVAGSLSAVSGVGSFVRDRSFDDSDGDGIPDETKQSTSFHRRLRSIFGNQFGGLEVGRPELLLDVRYVGDTSIYPVTKRTIVDLLRTHGIHAQWLDYPTRYDAETISEQYGGTVKNLLWGRNSFYSEEVENALKNVALQLLVVPGSTATSDEGRIYSHWMDAAGGGVDGYVNGFSLGNRAVVADREDRLEEAALVLHEIAHLVLCHDNDPENTGVMGTAEEVDLMDHEWEQFRNGLDNVRDTTGYDLIFRPCLWEENLSAVLE
ncbi:hypothetical protein [Natronobacterium texcoconense]|uniref:Uncharacterized protein n=1 Tax=Natronobacterium texcoconense TaxID=1095778 RepID=A0A1H1AI97_NATTX|nr:hypothetical protein [Natronobacterium texcoconense]SDQ39404.1 hypothetical protein SAMN04489842_0704 [Natronobacterium texcoconense]